MAKVDFKSFKRGMIRQASDYITAVRMDNMKTDRLKETQLTKEQRRKKEEGRAVDPSFFREVVPTLEGLAIYLNRTVEDIKRYASERPKFYHVVEMVKMEQAKRLITGGLRGDFHPSIVKLLLGSHGYVGKQELLSPVRDPEIKKSLKTELDRILQDNKIPIEEDGK
jgi:hypothetical protein